MGPRREKSLQLFQKTPPPPTRCPGQFPPNGAFIAEDGSGGRNSFFAHRPLCEQLHTTPPFVSSPSSSSSSSSSSPLALMASSSKKKGVRGGRRGQKKAKACASERITIFLSSISRYWPVLTQHQLSPLTPSSWIQKPARLENIVASLSLYRAGPLCLGAGFPIILFQFLRWGETPSTHTRSGSSTLHMMAMCCCCCHRMERKKSLEGVKLTPSYAFMAAHKMI